MGLVGGSYFFLICSLMRHWTSQIIRCDIGPGCELLFSEAANSQQTSLKPILNNCGFNQFFLSHSWPDPSLFCRCTLEHQSTQLHHRAQILHFILETFVLTLTWLNVFLKSLVHGVSPGLLWTSEPGYDDTIAVPLCSIFCSRERFKLKQVVSMTITDNQGDYLILQSQALMVCLLM